MKNVMRNVLVVVIWVACGRMGRNQVLSDLTNAFPDQCNADANITYLTWPVWWPLSKLHYSGPIISTPLTKQQRWEAFNAKGYGVLGFDYFNREDGYCLGDPDPDFRPTEAQ